MVENKENFEKGLNFEKVKYKLYKIQLNEKEKIQNLIFDNIQPSIYYFLKYLDLLLLISVCKLSISFAT